MSTDMVPTGPKHLMNEKNLWRMSRTLKGINSKSGRIVYLPESEASVENVPCSESEASATITPRRNWIDRILIRKNLKLGGEILEIFRLEA